MPQRPFVGSIERLTNRNRNFRREIFTGSHLQIVLMSVPPGGEIGEEIHRTVDQFFRIEQGQALFLFGPGGSDGTHKVRAGDVVAVPAGTVHNVVNTSRSRDLKLYTIYSPPKHRRGTIQASKASLERVSPRRIRRSRSWV